MRGPMVDALRATYKAAFIDRSVGYSQSKMVPREGVAKRKFRAMIWVWQKQTAHLTG